MSDFVEMAATLLPEQQRVTVLEGLEESTTLEVASHLSELLGRFVSFHAQHPGIVMLLGEYRALDIQFILPRSMKFTHRVVKGIDNRTLPYHPFFPDPYVNLRPSYKEVDA